jgi:hypothetical protein
LGEWAAAVDVRPYAGPKKRDGEINVWGLLLKGIAN